MGSRGTLISGQPRHSHQWAAEALSSVGSRDTHTMALRPFKVPGFQAVRCSPGGLHQQPADSLDAGISNCLRDPWENCKNVVVISAVSLSFSLLPSSPIGQPRHSHQWAAKAITLVGSRGTLISGQPRHSHQWAAEALSSVGSRDTHTMALRPFKVPGFQAVRCSPGGLHQQPADSLDAGISNCLRDPWENCKNVVVISAVSLSFSLLPSSPIGQPRHSHQWAAEALTSVGSRGTLISGQPRHSHLSQLSSRSAG